MAAYHSHQECLSLLLTMPLQDILIRQIPSEDVQSTSNSYVDVPTSDLSD